MLGFLKWLGPSGVGSLLLIFVVGGYFVAPRVQLFFANWHLETCENRLGVTERELQDLHEKMSAYKAEVTKLNAQFEEERQILERKIASLSQRRQAEREDAVDRIVTLQEELYELRKIDPATCALSDGVFRLWNKSHAPTGTPVIEGEHSGRGPVALPPITFTSGPDSLCRESSRGCWVIPTVPVE